MADPRPLLYLSRALPAAVMTTVRERYRLVVEPTEGPPTVEALHAGLRRAAAAIVTLTERIDREALEGVTNLRILANYAVGYNNIDLAAAQQRRVIVTNTPDVLTDATADLTWALLLATARRVVEGDGLVRSGGWVGWTATQLLGAEVTGRTLGIIGMGRIGQAVAQRAVGFRMPILYHSRRPLPTGAASPTWRAVALPTLLQQSDFISLHVPLTPDTRHLIDAAALKQMRPTAILINTARGPIVDESALVEALRAGQIAGAGLDVYEREPAVDPRLASLSQVVMLPHVGSATATARIKMGMICLQNIEAVLAGRPAPNEVQA